MARICSAAPVARAHITLDVWPHPLTAEGRTTRRLPWAPGITFADVLAGQSSRLSLGEDVICEVNGVRADPAAPLPPGAFVVLRARAADGLRSLLQVAVILASIYVPGASAFATWSAGATKALSAGILLGGQLVINTLVPLNSIRNPSCGRVISLRSISGR